MFRQWCFFGGFFRNRLYCWSITTHIYIHDNAFGFWFFSQSVVVVWWVVHTYTHTLLRSTINYYNRKAQDDFQKLASAELERKHDLDHANNLENVTNCDNSNSTPGSTGGGGGGGSGMVPMTSDPSGGSGGAPFPHQVSNYNSPSNLNLHNMDHLMLSASQRRRRELDLVGSIRDQTAVFLCIQSHSEGRWGLMHSLMSTLAKLGLDVIDHRAWHPRGIDTTLVSEIYAKDILPRGTKLGNDGGEGGGVSTHHILENRLQEIKDELELAINQPDVARVKVQRWYPGVVEEVIVECSDHNSGSQRFATRGGRPPRRQRRHLSLDACILQEASERLTARQTVQTAATREKRVQEILLESIPELYPSRQEGDELLNYPLDDVPTSQDDQDASQQQQQQQQASHRRSRRKVHSSPVVGGGLFGENNATSSQLNTNRELHNCRGAFEATIPNQIVPPVSLASGRAAISVDNEVYDVRVSSGTLKKLQGWRSGSMTVGGPSVGDYQRIGSRRYGYFYGGSGKGQFRSCRFAHSTNHRQCNRHVTWVHSTRNTSSSPCHHGLRNSVLVANYGTER